MAVSFGIHTSNPSLLRCQLDRLEGEVALHDHAPFNALGVGSFAQEDILLQRQPASSPPLGLLSLAPTDPSGGLLYQAQWLPAQVSLEDSAQPFRFQGWLFTFDGLVPGLAELREELLASLPPYLQRQMGAETAGEAAFSLFLKGLRDVGRTEDRRLEPGVVAELLGKALRELVRRSAQTGVPLVGSVTAMATNARVLAAARVSERPLHYKLLEGTNECATCGLAPGHSEVEPAARAHLRGRAVAVASHLKPGARWLELANGTALGVGPSLEPHVVAV